MPSKGARRGGRPTQSKHLISGFFRRLLPLHQFDVQAERLQLADQDVEGFRHARLNARLALDDGFVDFRAAINVVGLCREQFLQDVRGTVGFKSPNFHFAEALSAKLRLAAQRLLSDERVWPDGASVNLVVHQVRELEHVDVANGNRLVEHVSGHSVEEVDLPGVRKTGDFQQVTDFQLASTVENRGGERNAVLEAFGNVQKFVVVQLAKDLPNGCFGEDFTEPAANGFGANFLAEQTLQAVAEFLAGPAEVGFENLSDVHTRRNAQRIQNNFDWSAIGHVRHVFVRNDARDDALVAVASGHFVADGELALHGDIDLDQLDDAWGQFVALFEFFLSLFGDFAQHVDLPRSHFLDFLDLFDQERILFVELEALEVASGDLFDQLAGQLSALDEQALVGLFVVQVGLKNFSAQQIGKALEPLVSEDADFVGQVLFQLQALASFNCLVPFVFFSALAGKDFDVDDGAFDARRAVERSVAHVTGFFTEDRAEQFFFRSERGFAFGSYFADENVARLNDRADADNAAFVQVAEERFADIGDVASNFFGTELGVARFDFVLFDVNRSVVIVLDQFFADQDGVFKVVAAPGHEGHQNVAAKSQFAAIGARAIGKYPAFFHTVANANDGLLVDASVLVGALEFGEGVDVRADFAAEYAGG